MTARKIQTMKGLKIHLKIAVTENGRKVVNDEITLPKLDDKILKRLNIPGFGSAQIQELVCTRKSVWRHLGLDYQVLAEDEKLEWK